MTESEKPKVTYMKHTGWSYVVIPVGKENFPLFIAHCKNCNTYYTKRLSYDDGVGYAGLVGNSGLPEWGCKEPVGLV